jgi:Fur family peroxide stress response transcriptional regulator
MEQYRGIGIKLTPQRLGILEYLRDNREHPSAEDIFREVRKKFPTMSFSTVYNTLEALLSKGHLIQLSLDPDRKRYDPNTFPHHHFICMSCRKIVDIFQHYDIPLPEAQRHSYKVVQIHISFYGTCPECKKKKS